MTTKTQTAVVDESKLILELRIDTQGFVHRTNSSAEKKDTLEGDTPLAGLSRHPRGTRERPA